MVIPGSFGNLCIDTSTLKSYSKKDSENIVVPVKSEFTKGYNSFSPGDPSVTFEKKDKKMHVIQTRSNTSESLDIEDCSHIWASREKWNRNPYDNSIIFLIKYTLKEGGSGKFEYHAEADRNKDFERISRLLQERKGNKTMIEKIKEQWEEHEDILFPLLVLIALDFFFNDGRFQKKIANVMNGMLEKVTKRFESKTEGAPGDE